jgi:iron complex outermembrane recepter protein
VGYAQVFAGSVPNKRSAYRQFEAIIADLGYAPPSRDPFDRVVDHNSEWRSGNDIGGVSLNIDHEIFGGTLTSTTAWYFWDWRPSNDRDFLGLNALSLSQAPSDHEQLTQEFRWAGDLTESVSGVFGVFAIKQELNPTLYTARSWAPISGASYRPMPPAQRSTVRPACWKASVPTAAPAWKPSARRCSASWTGAWVINLSLLTGLRFNYDEKDVNFQRTRSGGSPLTDPALLALRNAQYSNQAFRPRRSTTTTSPVR